jgi:hypothetical protein
VQFGCVNRGSATAGCTGFRADRVGLGVILALFVLLATFVAVATPPWEGNDEPDHFLNAATLAQGRLYQIEPGAGLEAHQPPLYYALLGLEIRATALDTSRPSPPANPYYVKRSDLFQYEHDVASDGSDSRRVGILRLTSVPLGVVTILAGYALGAALTARSELRLAIAATVAFVPRFVFVSGMINNDNLATALSAVAIALAAAALVGRPQVSETRLLLLAGFAVGAGILTKLTVVVIAAALLVSAAVLASNRIRAIAAIAGPVLAVSGWWFVRNAIQYGDPTLLPTARRYLGDVLPTLVVDGITRRHIFWELPKGIWKSFWYTSGANQFTWPWPWYLPFWILVAAALVALWIAVRRATRRQARIAVFIASVGLAGRSNVWLAGLQTNQVQARIAFVALTALAAGIVLGLGRLPAGRWLIWATPMLGVAGTLWSIENHILLIR